MLQFVNLTKTFGSFTAVENLNLQINKGDLFGFLGPNGAGKTTTIKMLVGLYSISAGKILIEERDIAEDPIETKRKFGYIPDQPFLYDKLTGEEYLYFSGGLYELDKKTVKVKIDEIVDLLKIGDWLYKRTETYSQGMRQRITIASAFIHDPEIIIIDEPMVGLDPQTAFIVKRFLKKKTVSGKTIFMSTHSLNVVEEICNRIGIINHGKLIFDEKIDKIEPMKKDLASNFEEVFIEITSSA